MNYIPKTIKIKVPMVVNEDNEWAIMAHHDWEEQTMIDEARGNLSGDYHRMFWVEIEVPVYETQTLRANTLPEEKLPPT